MIFHLRNESRILFFRHVRNTISRQRSPREEKRKGKERKKEKNPATFTIRNRKITSNERMKLWLEEWNNTLSDTFLDDFLMYISYRFFSSFNIEDRKVVLFEINVDTIFWCFFVSLTK